MVIDWQQQQTKAAIFRSYNQVFFALVKEYCPKKRHFKTKDLFPNCHMTLLSQALRSSTPLVGII